MKDTRKHYPKEPITFGLLPGVWKTAGTMCDKRRTVDYVTDTLSLVTCSDCKSKALYYWQEQAATCRALIAYEQTGRLRGTSAESEAKELMPKLREALTQAEDNIAVITGAML